MKEGTAHIELDGGSITLARGARLSEQVKHPYAEHDAAESFDTKMQLSGWAPNYDRPPVSFYQSKRLLRAVLNTGFATFEIRNAVLVSGPELSGDGSSEGWFVKLQWDHNIYETEGED